MKIDASPQQKAEKEILNKELPSSAQIVHESSTIVIPNASPRQDDILSPRLVKKR